MDRKSIIILVVCFVLLLMWSSIIVPKLYPSRRPAPGQTNAYPSTVQTPQMPAAAAPAPESAVPATTAGPQGLVNTNENEETLVLTNKASRYTFSSYWGGLKLVELLDYPESVASWQGKGAVGNRGAMLNTESPAPPTLAVLGGEGLQGDGIFHLSPMTNGVRAEKRLHDGLVLVKEFVPGANYLLNTTIWLENQSTNTIALPAQEWEVGTATPMNPQDNGSMLGIMWYNGQKASDTYGASYFSAHGFACVPRVPPTEFKAGQSNVVWAAVHNQYFAMALMPQEPALEVLARPVALPRPAGGEAQLVSTNAPAPVGYSAVIVYPGASLKPGEKLERRFLVYAGPKEYRTLAHIANRQNNRLDALMGFGTFWGFFSKGLLLGMNGLHELLKISYGWTIVAITVLIKLVFWPLTAASTRSMKRMQALQPQINVIKEKFKDDPMKVQRKTMELFKENKVNPMGGCLPMAIQMPVFIGFFTMIRSAIELRGATFFWIKDLSKPDTLFIIPGMGFVPFVGVPGVGLPFNLLPLIMGATMLWQTHLTPPSPGVDAAQQKIMRYMPLIFLVFLYNYSAGMALYWTVNNLLTILQTKLTRARQATPPVPALTQPPKRRK